MASNQDSVRGVVGEPLTIHFASVLISTSNSPDSFPRFQIMAAPSLVDS
jgi:hypothetical protein